MGFQRRTPSDVNPKIVADTIVKVVATEHGQRPFRVHVDPCDDGCEVVNQVADRIRNCFLKEMGLGELLTVKMQGS